VAVTIDQEAEAYNLWCFLRYKYCGLPQDAASFERGLVLRQVGLSERGWLGRPEKKMRAAR
jgi:hypothetical protein